MPLCNKKILLIIAGGIAAYKSLDLIRRLKDAGATVRCVLTAGGAQFVTPLSVAALSGQPVHQDLFSLTDETEMGHIRLSRESDLLVVAPATADLMAKMAHGLADDLASTLLLATNRPVLVAPAMNVCMWDHPATQANLALLRQRGVAQVGPDAGELACGEVGSGRMAAVEAIVATVQAQLAPSAVAPAPEAAQPLAGRRALVTSGPTYEALDPVRFIGNRSSGKQGHAIAAALAELGAAVTLVSGPVALADPPGVRTIHIESAREMLAACQAEQQTGLDLVVCAAAVADWRAEVVAAEKTKKTADGTPPVIRLTLNPDILASLSRPGPDRPALVVGFAAETEQVLEYATAKLARKGCDLIVANDVSPATGTFGGESNQVHLISRDGIDSWPALDKTEVARRLAHCLADRLAQSDAGRSGTSI